VFIVVEWAPRMESGLYYYYHYYYYYYYYYNYYYTVSQKNVPLYFYDNFGKY